PHPTTTPKESAKTHEDVERCMYGFLRAIVRSCARDASSHERSTEALRRRGRCASLEQPQRVADGGCEVGRRGARVVERGHVVGQGERSARRLEQAAHTA